MKVIPVSCERPLRNLMYDLIFVQRDKIYMFMRLEKKLALPTEWSSSENCVIKDSSPLWLSLC